MVRQNGPTFPAQPTVNPFLLMIPAHLRRSEALPLPVDDVAPTLLVSSEAAPPAPLPGVADAIRQQLAEQANTNRAQRREFNRGRLRELLDAPTNQPAPDFVSPTPQEGRTGMSVRVRVSQAAPAAPPVRQEPDWKGLSAAAVLEAAPKLSTGARAVFEILHAVAVAASQSRKYRVIPTTAVYHLPQILLAAVADYTPRHLRRAIIPELERAGLVDAGAHASNVTTKAGETRRMWDGSLWAVKVQPHPSAARLTPDDWRHEWRTFGADLKAGRTANAKMSYLKTTLEPRMKLEALQQWAVNPSSDNIPLLVDRTFSEASREAVQDVVYSLPLLAELRGNQLVEGIGRAASEIAHALNDQHSRRYWCALLWAATRNGTLSHLSAQLLRLLTDLIEWPDLKNPGAVFAARRASAA